MFDSIDMENENNVNFIYINIDKLGEHFMVDKDTEVVFTTITDDRWVGTLKGKVSFSLSREPKVPISATFDVPVTIKNW